jgi:hypothetical protein
MGVGMKEMVLGGREGLLLGFGMGSGKGGLVVLLVVVLLGAMMCEGG